MLVNSKSTAPAPGRARSLANSLGSLYGMPVECGHGRDVGRRNFQDVKYISWASNGHNTIRIGQRPPIFGSFVTIGVERFD